MVMIDEIFFLAIHCMWGEWELGECSEECGDGQRTDTRVKLVEEQYRGTCSGQPSRIETCKIKECPGILIFELVLVYLAR